MRKEMLAVAVLALAGVTSAHAQQCSAPPAAAAAAGFTAQTYGGNGITIGQNWLNYSAAGSGTTQNADGTVTIANPTNNGYNDQLVSAANFGGGGYFQATLSFTGTPTTNGGWPSFWGGTTGTGPSVETDIMEYFPTGPAPNLIYWTQGVGGGDRTRQDTSTDNLPAGFDPSQPNTYGMLWTSSQVTFYVDGVASNTIPISSSQLNLLNSSQINLSLGTGSNAMTVYDVSVWQNPATANDTGINVSAAAANPCVSTALASTTGVSEQAITPTDSTSTTSAAGGANVPGVAAASTAAAGAQTTAASTQITPGQGTTTDCDGNTWTINGNNKILENGQPVAGGGDTSALTTVNCVVYGLSNGQNGSTTGWFTLNGQNWVASTAPPGGAATTAAAGQSPTVCGSGVASGAFHVANGRIVGPNGQTFIPRGINMADNDMGSAAAAIALFPGLNFVRLAIYSYQDPSAYASFISTMTLRGTVVEIEHHVETDGSTAGGGQGGIAGGSWLAAENAFYAAMAQAYASNSYVWFGTTNEPPTAPGLSQWQQATYNAIRGAGNTSIVMLELAGWPGGWQTDMDPSVYASMTNVVWDTHYYGWISRYSTDQNTVNQALASEIAGAQTVTSADGVVPALIGEYGPSTTGDSMDANGNQAVTSVINDGGSGTAGSAAWHWGMQDCCNNLNNGTNLTSPYGQEVLLYINTSVVPCTATEATANAMAQIAADTAQVSADAQTPAASPATTQPAATPSSATEDPATTALSQQAAASIAQANAIVGAAQQQQQAAPAGTQ